MFIIIDTQGNREVGVNADGTTTADLNQAELFSTSREAEEVASRHGGRVYSEQRVFGDDVDDVDFE